MKKYILLLFMITGFMQAQTLQNPTFGNTTTNKLVVKTPSASSDFDPLLSRDPASFNTKTRSIVPEYLRFNSANATISALGDSMTDGAGTTNYPTQLTATYGYTVVNMGVGGETSTQIKTRWLADPLNYDKPVIIWAGRNNFTNPADPTNVPTVKADIAAIVASLTHTNYLVVGVVNGVNQPINSAGWVQMTTLNNDLKALYGTKFVALREYIVSKYNPLIPQDVIDHNNDIPASSLRVDTVHLNTLGNKYVAEFILQRLGNLFGSSEYIRGLDFNYYLGVLNGVKGTGTSSQVPFWTAANTISGNSDFTWNNTTKNLNVNGSITGVSTANLVAGQNFFTFQRNLNFHSGGTSEYRAIDNTTINNDGNTFTAVIGKETTVTNTKSTASGNINSVRNRVNQNGSGTVASIVAVDGLVSGSGTGAVTNLNVFSHTPLSPTNPFPITNYRIFSASGVFNGSNISNAYGISLPDMAGTVSVIAADLNVMAGSVKWNLYAGGTAKNYFNGSVLIGSNVDNTVDKLQVTGSAAFSSTIKAGATVRLKSYTVATLPTGIEGDIAYVTDALAPTYMTTIVGGGAIVTPVFYNGTNWIAH